MQVSIKPLVYKNTTFATVGWHPNLPMRHLQVPTFGQNTQQTPQKLSFWQGLKKFWTSITQWVKNIFNAVFTRPSKLHRPAIHIDDLKETRQILTQIKKDLYPLHPNAAKTAEAPKVWGEGLMKITDRLGNQLENATSDTERWKLIMKAQQERFKHLQKLPLFHSPESKQVVLYMNQLTELAAKEDLEHNPPSPELRKTMAEMIGFFLTSERPEVVAETKKLLEGSGFSAEEMKSINAACERAQEEKSRLSPEQRQLTKIHGELSSILDFIADIKKHKP